MGAHHRLGPRTDALYFASGPEDETHGVFDLIVPSRRCTDDSCKAHM